MTLHHFSDADVSEYQSFVNSHSGATPYHSLAWGLSVKSCYGFKIHYLGLKINDEIVAVMPAILMSTIRGKKNLCSLPYCDMGGILANSGETADNLKQQVIAYANQRKWTFEYRDTYQPGSSDLSDEIAQGTKVRMLYTLQTNVDEQMASFKPKLRSQIKKAAKNGITSQTIANPTQQDLARFYEVFAINMRDLGSPVHSKKWFEAIFNEYGQNAFLVLVEFEGKCVGGGVVIHTHNKAVIPWASTLREYNKLAPNMLLYWDVLCEVIQRGITNFDFGRSGYNEGTFRFKKQWGAEPLPLKWESLINSKLCDEQTSEKSSLRSGVESMWQKMPIGLTTALGPKIRKYISL